MAKKVKATKKVAKKVAAKATKKATAKKVAPKKATKKAAPKKATKKVAKKASKKVAPKKATAKKATAKKVAPKKATVKAPAKKVAPKKVTTKKAAPKKAIKVSAPQVENKETAAVVTSGNLEVGQMAPEFTLQDQNGKSVSLKDYLGSNVVVYFYPKAMTPGCTTQACGLRDSQSTLAQENIVVLGISADEPSKLKKFEEKEKLNFTLLSDPDHAVARAYGSFGPKKFMGREFDGILRQSFLVDKTGKIVHIIHKVDTNNHHETVTNFFKNP